MPPHQRISIVVPFYNEERSIPILFDALTSAVSAGRLDAEFIFVDDGSTDRSAECLERLAAQDARVKVLGLARNFGKEIAVTAGIQHCSGDACITLDADLQHPVELIPEFVRRWQHGAEVVVGVRTKNAGEGMLRHFAGRLFYFLMGAISETPITPNATDYRLLDRVVVDEFNRFTERRRMTRALVDWLGFRREYVPIEAPARLDGGSRYGTGRLVRLAVSGFVSHSLFPLKIAGYLGVIITVAAGLLGSFIFVEKYILRDPLHLFFSGPAILAVINLFLAGVMLSCLGLIALYIATIHAEVTNRPLYSVRVRRNFDDRRT